MRNIASQRSPLYASQPAISYHHDQFWAGTPTHFLEHLYNAFDYRADDVWLSSYPRSGTAWTYEVLYAVLYQGDIAALQHAQRTGQILKFLPIEIGSAVSVPERLYTWKALPSPRVIPTHLPYRLYPKAVLERHCERVYVVRHPKDVAAIADYASFASMSVNLFTNRAGKPLMDFSIARFLRKGMVGDWKNHFTAEQNVRFQTVWDQKMGGTALQQYFAT